MASAKSILERMIAAMNRGGDAAVLKAKDIEAFAKPRPKKKRALKKSPAPLRKNRNSKARKKPRKRQRSTNKIRLGRQ
jgi:hypothetical protein